MKKFLLTLLGASLLCGLSPHPLSAQSTQNVSMDLQLRAEDHNADLQYTNPTVGETLTDWFDVAKTSAAAANGGFTRIENSDFIIEFNYFDPLGTTDQAKSHYTSGTWCSLVKKTPGITIYPGTRIRIKLRDTTKRIIALNIKTGVINTTFLDYQLTNIHPIKSFDNGGDDKEVTTRRYDYTENSLTFSAIGLSGFPTGFAEGVVIELPKSGCKNMLNANGTLISSISTSNGALVIAGIEAEVMDVANLPKIGTIYGYTSSVEEWNSNQWQAPTKSTYDDETVKFRLNGKVIVEFTRTDKTKADKPTATYDAENQTLGAHLAVNVRSYPDPSFTYNGNPSTMYSVEYRLNNPFKGTTFSSAYYSSYNLTPVKQFAGNSTNNNNLKQYLDGTKLKATALTHFLATAAEKPQIAISRSIAVLSRSAGIDTASICSPFLTDTHSSHKYCNPTTTNNSDASSVCDGTLPAIVFDEVDLIISTDETTGSRAPVLSVSAADGDAAILQADGSRIFKNAIKVTATFDDDRFPKADLYYMTEGTAFDKSKATPVPEDGIITINASCTLKVYAVVTVDGKEVASDAASVTLHKLQVKSVDSYAELLKEENNGQPVMINFTTRTRFSGRLQRAQSPIDLPKYPFAFIYDNEGNPVKILSNHISTSGDLLTTGLVTTGTTRVSTLFVNPSSTLDDDKFIEAGSIIGVCRIVNGHPEIILTDEIGDDKFDYRDFCATKPRTAAEIGLTEDQKKAADEAFAKVYESEELSQEHWGRFVRIHHLSKYNATDSTFVDKGGEGRSVKVMYSSANNAFTYPYIWGTSAFYNSSYSTYFGNLKNSVESTKATVGGLVDYRHKTTDMVIHVNQVYYNLSKPVFIAKAGTNTITERDTSDPDADQTFDMVSLSGSNALSLSVDLSKGQPQSTQVALGALKYFDLNDEEKQINNAVSGKLVNGRYLLKVVATIPEKTIQPLQEASSTVAVYDPVKSRPGSYLISDFDKLTPEEIAANPYINILWSAHYKQPYDTDLGKLYPTLMVYKTFSRNENGINTYYYLVREVKRDIESEDEPIIPDNDYPKWHIVKSTTPRYSKYWEKRSGTNKNWTTKNRSLLTDGDGIEYMVAKIEINSQGNLIYDNSGASFQSYCKILDAIQSSKNEQPFFIDEFSELTAIEDFTDVTKANINKERLNTIISLPDAVITKDADGEYRVNTATANALTWNILRTDDKDTHTGMIDQAQEGDRFAVKALVVNDGKGGYALEVVDFKAGYARSLHVCDHPSHDSYFAKKNFDGVDAGKQVEMLGVKLTKDADGNVTTELSSPVSLVWTSFANLEDNHKALIMDEDPNTKQTITFNVAGTLLRDDDGAVSIDVNELTQVKSYGYSQDFQNMFVINDAPYNLYLDPQYNNFYDYVKVEARGPGYLTAYYRYSPTLEGLEDADEVEFDESRIAKLGVTGYYEFYTCNPGKRGLYRHVPRLFTKFSSNAGSIADILDDPKGYGDNEIAKYHFTGSLLITGTSQYEYHPNTDNPSYTTTGYIAMATDADGRHIRILFQDSYKFIPEVGQHVADFGLAQTTYHWFDADRINRRYNLIVNSNFKPIKPVEPDEADRIDMPKSIVRAGLDAADKGRRVRLIDMKISGNDTDGYTLTPAEGTEPIRLNNVLYWTPAEGFDPDGEYAVEGYVMPAKPADATASLTALADTEEEVEFWPLYEEAKRQTGKPELKVEGYESVEDNSYVTVEPVKLTAAVVDGPDANAPIEYSIDGGEWTVMTDGTLTVDRSASISVRAHIPGFSPSETLSVEIRREYYSEEAVIAAEQKSGYTAVTFAAGENASADTDFTVYYTLDGTEPDMNSAKFTAGMKPIELTEAVNVKALMVEEGKRPAKSIASQAVAVRANDLEITLEKGEGFTTVTIAPKDPKHVDPKAEIRYTTDGTEPTAQSKLYTAPFEVEAADNGMTIKAICIEPQKTNGLVATQTVAVEGLRPSCDVTITYREKDGVYYITLTAEAGTIHYSLNGAEEKIYNGKSIEYTPAADGTCTITAYALEEGKRAGKTATESFAVTGISGIGADEAESVSVEGNTIIVPEGAQTFDIAGRRVNPQGLPRGIYIVRLASGKAVKAVVK